LGKEPENKGSYRKLDDGKIAGIGKHKQLLESCPVYKEIALSQLSEEEL